jgi:hypothetical protein
LVPDGAEEASELHSGTTPPDPTDQTKIVPKSPSATNPKMARFKGVSLGVKAVPKRIGCGTNPTRPHRRRPRRGRLPSDDGDTASARADFYRPSCRAGRLCAIHVGGSAFDAWEDDVLLRDTHTSSSSRHCRRHRPVRVVLRAPLGRDERVHRLHHGRHTWHGRLRQGLRKGRPRTRRCPRS